MKALTTIILTMFVATLSIAQQKTISGIVSDSTGPLPGVIIIVKGTTNGTQTDFDGKYTILVQTGDILVYTYVGFKTKEVTIKESSIVNVTLIEDVACLDEVVVTGYSASKGRAMGYSVKKKMGLSHSNSDLRHGQLTAGEINDLENWNAWKRALKSNDFSQMQEKWQFYLLKKIKVKVIDESNMPIANCRVNLFTEHLKKIGSTLTDALGNAVIFIDKETYKNTNSFVVQSFFKNKLKGVKAKKKQDEIIFTFNDIDSTSNDVDIMFTIDATGSMSDEMEYLKVELKDIISRIDKSIEKKRVALTFYRDEGDEFVVRDFDFDTNINSVKESLERHYANGGGDYEEAVEKALKVSLYKSWNTQAKSRLMFLLLDAPPHYNESNVNEIKEQIARAQKIGVKIIPIVASDADKNVEFLMRFFSVSTNGTYVFLTDHSGIGNDHLEPTESKYKVEKLNDLIVRLINKYCGVS